MYQEYQFMALRDPVAIYIAATNVDAHLIANALIESGVEATVVEDVSTGGLWMFGLLSQIHKPDIWVERSDTDRARTVLERYEQQATTHRDAPAAGDPSSSNAKSAANAR